MVVSENPLISVVIVAGLDRKRELMRCLRSILNSSYQNLEVIIVDNSQNPRLASLVETKFPQVRLLRMPQNTGVLGFNIGFANARGDYVLALDDDCTVNSDTLEKIVAIFPKKPKNVGVISTNIYNPLSRKYVFDRYLKLNLTNLFIAAGAAVFRREIFSLVGYYDADFFLWIHEGDLSIRILNQGYKINFEKEIVVNHYLKKPTSLRKDMVYFLSRNLVWFNIKHFSLCFWPLLIARNFVTLFLMPFKRRSPLALIYALVGYFTGWFTFYIPLKKRKVVNFKLQKKFLRFYLFNLL